ncbi:hypothetical protein E4T66_18080 [Sinimarinibacterium sp. CAU 1509]|uniref:DNA-binding protein n=1 Tax=Sinimarinibacterium sp. CAU 1509 TaxID=2562283 RepID=UPI0010AC47F2|nr:DNA-binding protein [Sinimarinibacterium sp. CAU 1509]TJY57314.1 hypothetical protein E4T66_18080 [Sinimarinibacterium sp. CAU 1509]
MTESRTQSYKDTQAAVLSFMEKNGFFPSVRDVIAERGSGSHETVHRHLKQVCAELVSKAQGEVPPGLPPELVEPARELVRIVREAETRAAQALSAAALAERDAMRAERDAADQQAKAAEAKATVTQSSLRYISEELDQARRDLTERSRQLQDAKSEQAATAQQLAAARTEIHERGDALQKATTQLAKLEEQLSAATETIEKERAESALRLKSLTARAVKAELERDQIASTAQNLEGAAQASATTIAALQAQLDRATKALRRADPLKAGAPRFLRSRYGNKT